MSQGPPRRVFASYSRRDARSVHELVRLIRMTGAPVFLDVDSIQTGERWRSALEAALLDADLVAVFWTSNAAQSEEVEREYRLALKLNKPIVPVLMDDSPLSAELAEFQGIALVDLFSAHDITFDPLPYVRTLVARLAMSHGERQPRYDAYPTTPLYGSFLRRHLHSAARASHCGALAD